MRDKYSIPRKLEAPYRFVVLTIDELAVFTVPLILNWILFSSVLMGFGIGVALTLLLRRAKGEQGSHYLLCLMYWHLPPIYQLKATPPSYQRTFIG